MSHRAAALSTALVAVLLAGASPVAAIPIANGDFSVFVPSNGTGGGWTSSLIDANGGWRSTTSENSFEDFFILNWNGTGTDPTLRQDISGFVVGETYTVTGEFESFRPGDGNPNALSFGVEIVGVALREYMRPPSLLGSFELVFEATAFSHTLRLTAERNGDDSAYAVDNVAIAGPTAMPEPSIGLLLGLAGLAMVVEGRSSGRASLPLRRGRSERSERSQREQRGRCQEHAGGLR